MIGPVPAENSRLANRQELEIGVLLLALVALL